MPQIPRRSLLTAPPAAAYALSLFAVGTVAGEHDTRAPDNVTLSYDDALIAEYQPQFVLDGVDPRPLAFHALHAESSESTLNAVYGFTRYPFQEGLTSADSHWLDHEPVIVWYDQASGDVEQVDYAAYHWFRGSLRPGALQFADEAQHRPILRVDPRYHHYYAYTGELAGERIERRNLIESIDSWLSNGMESELALSQPFDPYAMLGRESWWRHTTDNRLEAWGKALWFNLGLSGARDTADVEEVSVW